MFGAGGKPAAKPGPATRRAAGAATPVSRPVPSSVAAAKPASVKAKPKKKGRSVFVDLAISIIISAVTAIAAGAAVALLTLQLQKTRTLAVFDSTPLIFGSFILVFFLAMLFQLNKMFKLFATLRNRGGNAAPVVARAQPVQRVMKRRVAPQDIEFTGVAVEKGAAPEPEPPPVDEPPPEAPPSLDEEPATASVAEPTPPAPQVSESSFETTTAAPEATKPAQPEPPAHQGQPVDDARNVFASFISESLTVVKRDVGDLNAVTKMGFNLFLSGGMATLGSARQLSRESQVTVLKQGLQAAGNFAERAAAFAAELPSYGKNPRYSGMIQAGAKAMEGHLTGQPQAPAVIGPMLAEWTLPEKRPSAPQVYTFMFTDMVGSTAITHELGNAEAQKNRPGS
jgi:adenylate cyclase